eukprot:TRINITY_DN12483_c0_g2_i1.p1 TRINITY_DN12483_c0_g2~~TRINITY_DN12483_c0_g2_i1.p1  ORF type:complete len:835 (+),score=185.01 TRINITY_DN12483_c0_g2_i1:1000-3504(+)
MATASASDMHNVVQSRQTLVESIRIMDSTVQIPPEASAGDLNFIIAQLVAKRDIKMRELELELKKLELSKSAANDTVRHEVADAPENEQPEAFPEEAAALIRAIEVEGQDPLAFQAGIIPDKRLNDIRDYLQATGCGTLANQIDGLTAKPMGWIEITDDVVEGWFSVFIKDVLEEFNLAEQSEDKNAAKADFMGQLASLLGSVRRPSGTAMQCAWLFSAEGGLTSEARIYLWEAIFACYESIFCTCAPLGGKQQLEGNVDIRIAVPMVFSAFKSNRLIHVYKEQEHQPLRMKRSGQAKARGEQPKRSYHKVDHSLELKTDCVGLPLVFGIGETARDVDSAKENNDVAKLHACSKATLNVLAMQEALPEELLSKLFVFGCTISGPKIQLRTYRASGMHVVVDELYDFNVPYGSLTDFRDKFQAVFLPGLLKTLQLASLTNKLAVEAKSKLRSSSSVLAIEDSARAIFSSETTPFKSRASDKHKSAGGLKPVTQSGEGHFQMEDCHLFFTTLYIKETVTRSHKRNLAFGFGLRLGTVILDPVALKHIASNELGRLEAQMHALAANLAEDGVLPLTSCATIGELTDALLRDELAELERATRFDLSSGCILVMPCGRPFLARQLGPIRFLKAVAHEIAQTVKTLFDNGLVHQDLRLDNVVLWRDRAVLIDFGYAGKRGDATDRRFLNCRYNPRQPPELAEDGFDGNYDEPQLVFMLGGMVLEGLAATLVQPGSDIYDDVIRTPSIDLMSELPTWLDLQDAWPEWTDEWSDSLMKEVLQATKSMLAPLPEHRCSLDEAITTLSAIVAKLKTINSAAQPQLSTACKQQEPVRLPLSTVNA